MRKKYLLCFTDEKIALYQETSKELFLLKETFDVAQNRLKNFLSNEPEARISIFLDRNHQDIREEKILSLLPWERILFLYHKKSEWAVQGGYAGFQFLKEEGETYFRWIHIPLKDPFVSLVSWIQSLPNPFGGIFFVPLEALGFLRKNLPNSSNYKMLIYNFCSQQAHHAIFKGNRLLLARTSQNEEDIKTSLHFLSRKYPDIHENLFVLSLIKDQFINFAHLKTLPGSQAFINFLASRKQPSFLLRAYSPSPHKWLGKGIGIVLASTLILCGFNVHQGFSFKKKSLLSLGKIEALKVEIHELQIIYLQKNIKTLCQGLEHYHYLNATQKSLFKTMEKLALLIKKSGVRLENFKWQQEERFEILVTITMKEKMGITLANQFEAFLDSCKEVFPKSKIQILVAPFNSGIHESFKAPPNTSLPLAQVRIIL